MIIKSFFTKLKNEIVNNPTFTLKEQLGYAGGLFGNAMGQDSIGTYSDKFCTDYMGISADDLTKKSVISSIVGFTAPPIAGVLLDKPTYVGKMSNTRKMIVSMPVPFALTSMLLFVVPSSNPSYNFLWALLLGMLFNFVDTFYDLALRTLSLRMTSNPQDRKNFYTIASLANTLGSMLPGWLIPLVVGSVKDDANRQQWLYFFVALGFCIIGVVAMYTPFFTLREKVGVIVQDESKPKVIWNRDTFFAILHNRPFIILEFGNLFDAIRQITYNLLPFLYENTLGDLPMKAVIDAISGALSYAGLLAVPFVGTKVSARTMLVGGYSYTGVFYTFISLFNIRFNLEKVRKLRYLIGILIGFSGMPNAAVGAAKRILVADSTDYMEWYSEKKYGEPLHSDGMLVATQSVIDNAIALCRKAFNAYVLGLIGYKPGIRDPQTNKLVKTVQTEETLRGIFTVSSLCGLIGSFLPALCYSFDTYTGKRRNAILAELADMRRERAEQLHNS